MRDPLQVIPGVGPSIASDLRGIGIDAVAELAGRDPEELFARLQVYQGVAVDRCALYVLRCAVYFAEGGRDAELLKWWSWKDSARPATATRSS